MTFIQRIRSCVVKAIAPALKTGLWIIKITVPVSFCVLLLKLTGLLPVIAGLFAPLFALFGMPGESALVFVTAGLVNIYACIGVMETLGLGGHTVTILALMCLISHSLPVETAVQKKTGSSFWAILGIRLSASFAGAFLLSLFLRVDPQTLMAADSHMVVGGFAAEFQRWLVGIALLCAKILILITLLMMLQRIMEEFGIIQWLCRMLKYPLMILGVPRQAAFLWIVANTLGLAYGAGIIIDHVERGRLSRKHADILNSHIAVSHSLLEDTLLFVAVGASLFWITIPRIILAAMVVWIKRLYQAMDAKRKIPAN
jgi:spore maturation protein SpmB